MKLCSKNITLVISGTDYCEIILEKINLIQSLKSNTVSANSKLLDQHFHF